MKSLTVALSAFTVILPVLAQDITSLPQCAQPPILDAINASGCPLTDIKCICSNNNFFSGLLAKLPTVCNTNEIALCVDFASSLCKAAGVTLSIPGTVASTSVASTSTASTSATSTSATQLSTTGTVISTTRSSSFSATSRSGTEAALTSVAQSSVLASVAAASSTAHAEVNVVGIKGLIGAVAMGLIVAL